MTNRRWPARGVACRHGRIDGERRPACERRRFDGNPHDLIRPLFAAHRRRVRPQPHEIERPGAHGLAGQLRPRARRILDREPRDGAGRRAAAHEIERQLRGEAVGRARFEHAVGRQRRAAEQVHERHRAERHRAAVCDVLRHVDVGRVGAREQRLRRQHPRRAVDIEFERRRGLRERARADRAEDQQQKRKPPTHQHSFSGKRRCGRRDARPRVTKRVGRQSIRFARCPRSRFQWPRRTMVLRRRPVRLQRSTSYCRCDDAAERAHGKVRRPRARSYRLMPAAAVARQRIPDEARLSSGRARSACAQTHARLPEGEMGRALHRTIWRGRRMQ